MSGLGKQEIRESGEQGIRESGDQGKGDLVSQRDNGLPDGWVLAAMKNICHVERGITFPSSAKKSRSDDDVIACLRTSNVQYVVDWEDLIYVPKTYVKDYTKLLQQDDILISMANSLSLVGKVSFVENVRVYSTFGAFISAIRSHENILPKYLFYALRTNKTKKRLREASSQTVNIANLSLGRLEPIPIPLAPFPEQHRIVEVIETQFTRLDAAVRSLKRAQIKLERYRASVLQAACEGRLVPTEAELAQEEGRDYEPADQLLERILVERRAKWEEDRWEYEVERAMKKAAQAERKAAGLPYYIRELEPEHWEDRTPEEYEKYLPKSDKWKDRYDEPQPPDTEDLAELPEGWVWVLIGNICKTTSGGTPNRGIQDYFGGDIPWLKSGELNDSIIYETEEFITKDGLQNSSAKIFPKGTLLIALYGATVGKLGILGIEASTNQAICALFQSEYVDKKYLFWFLRKQREKLLDARFGGAQPNISQTILRAINIPLVPLVEQHRIVAEAERRLSVVDALEETVSANLIRAERMRQAILKKAFEGRLVEQRPEDGDARELLERIKVEPE